MVKQLHPRARDAAQRRIKRITLGVIAASLAGTLGIGAGIAIAAPPPKAKNKTDYNAKNKNKPANTPTPAGEAPQAPQVNTPAPQAPQTNAPKANTPAPKPPPKPANDKPESSTGDEETTSGGS